MDIHEQREYRWKLNDATVDKNRFSADYAWNLIHAYQLVSLLTPEQRALVAKAVLQAVHPVDVCVLICELYLGWPISATEKD